MEASAALLARYLQIAAAGSSSSATGPAAAAAGVGGGGIQPARPPEQRKRRIDSVNLQVPCCAEFDPIGANLLLEALHEPESAVGMAASQCFAMGLMTEQFKLNMCRMGFHCKGMQCKEYKFRFKQRRSGE